MLKQETPYSHRQPIIARIRIPTGIPTHGRKARGIARFVGLVLLVPFLACAGLVLDDLPAGPSAPKPSSSLARSPVAGKRSEVRLFLAGRNTEEEAQALAVSRESVLDLDLDDDKAFIRLSELLALHPGDPVLLQTMSQYYIARGRLFSAETTWAELAQQYPDNGSVLSVWGGLQLRTRQFEKAAQTLPQSYALMPESLSTRYNLLLLHAINRDYGRMRPLLNNLFAYEAVGILDFFMDEIASLVALTDDEALDVFVNALLTGSARRPPSPKKSATNEVEALDQLVDAEEVEPPPPPTEKERAEQLRARLAPISQALRQARETAEFSNWPMFQFAMEQAIEAGATAPYFRSEIASALRRQGKLEEARSLIEDLSRRNPTSVGAAFTKAELFMYMGRMLEAERTLDPLLRSKPRDPLLLYSMACALAEQGYEEQAVDLLTSSVQIQPAILRQAIEKEEPPSKAIRTSPIFEGIRQQALSPVRE